MMIATDPERIIQSSSVAEQRRSFCPRSKNYRERSFCRDVVIP
jgi:hypothetical protein